MLFGAHADEDSLASREGAGSATQVSLSSCENECEHADSMSVPWGINVHLLSATPHAGNGTGVTGGLWETGGCPGMEGAVIGVTSTAHNTLYRAPPRGYPVE